MDAQLARAEFHEVGVRERSDDRVEVFLDQREQVGVADVAGRDDQEPSRRA
jgi:hypothetical protein